MFTDGMAKPLIYLAIVSLVATTWAIHNRMTWKAGYDSARAEMQEDFIDDLAASIASKDRQVEAATVKAETWRVKAIEAQNKKPTVLYVEKIIEKNPDCRVIVGFSELFKQASAAE
jgi:hypothetical protein